MSNKTPITQNTVELQEILATINNLPEAGGGGNAKEEQEKSLDVTENGTYDIVPDSGKVLSKATVKVNVPIPSVKEEQTKTVTVTSNGTTEVTPDEGKTLSKVTINTSVPGGTGEIGKPYIDTSLITDFKYFCYGNSRQDVYDKIDTSNGVNFTSMFQLSEKITNVPQLNTGKGTNFSYMFNGCNKLTEIPPLDISNGTNFLNVFTGCSQLTTVSLTAPSVSLSTSTFISCSALANVTIGNGWAVDIYLQYSPNLTVESLHGMIENLADLTGQTAKTFQIGATNLAKIDAEHLTMLQNKNWNYS